MEVLKFKRYESTAELSAELSRGRVYKSWERCGYAVSNLSDGYMREWAGATLSEAAELLAHGDAESAAKIRACGEIRYEANEAGRPRLQASVTGCLPCVPNYLRGVPNSMMRLQAPHNDTPVIDMYVNCSIGASIETNDAVRVGTDIANTIAAVEQAGVRVNLYAVCVAKHGEYRLGACVKLKDCDAPLNLLNISYAITHPAFVRCTFLLWVEQNINKSMHLNVISEDAELAGLFGLNGVILSVHRCVRDGITQEQMVKKVNEYIKHKQGKR